MSFWDKHRHRGTRGITGPGESVRLHSARERQLLALVTELAEREPTYQDEDMHDVCVFCGSRGRSVMDTPVHRVSCLWVRARGTVAPG